MSNKIFTILRYFFANLQGYSTFDMFQLKDVRQGIYIDLIEINQLWSSVKVWPCFAIGH